MVVVLTRTPGLRPVDSDLDGIPDAQDDDDDNDGILDAQGESFRVLVLNLPRPFFSMNPSIAFTDNDDDGDGILDTVDKD